MKHLKVLIFADMAKKTLLFLCLYELFRLNSECRISEYFSILCLYELFRLKNNLVKFMETNWNNWNNLFNFLKWSSKK